jgi:DNA-binding CsgD family transcriptional regulator
VCWHRQNCLFAKEFNMCRIIFAVLMTRLPQLVGREHELDRIDRLLEGARAADGGALVLRGEAGIGKSALLDVARARASGMQVLACRGTESEARLPFAALHRLLHPALQHLDRIPAVQSRALRTALGLASHARPEPFLVALATLSLLAEAARHQPVLCLVDDAHWVDRAALDVLGFVARRVQAEPLAMLIAMRDAPFDVEHFPLHGLDPDASHELLRSGAELSPAVADQLVEASGGNPLALIELSRALSPGQRDGSEPLLEPLPLGARLEHEFLARVRELPEPTQQLLLVAAAEERGDAPVILEAAAQLGIGGDAIDAAEQAGLIRMRGIALELRHPLVRSAVYRGAPLSRRRAAHAALAAVLVDESAADRRAWHRAAASVEPDPAVVAELERAGERASARAAHDAASIAFERAAALAPREADRSRLLTLAADHAWRPGRQARAELLLRRARAMTATPEVRADGIRLAGLIELTCGVPAESSRMLAAAAREVARADAERALYLLSLASWGAAFAREADAVIAIAETAQTLDVPPTPRNRFLLLRLAGLRAHFRRDFAEAAARLQETLALLPQLNADGLPDRLGLVNPVGLFLCDDRDVLELHRQAAAHAREEGLVTLLAQAIPWLALGDIWSGHWQLAAARLDEGLELAQATNQHQITAHLIAIQALLAAVRGDEERCRAHARAALELASARRLVHVGCCATWALSVLELGLGNAEAAMTHASALPNTDGVDWDALDRIEAAVHTGERRAAARWLETFEPWAKASAAPWGEAVALHCRALLASDACESERLFRAALDRHEQAARPFERARTELAFGAFLRRGRHRAEARPHLRAALERFQALGSRLWAQRAQSELRASGETARKRDPSTLDDLTPQELQVGMLAAEGHTNREIAGRLFLSPRTIDFHLRNVFRKLGIRSRTELARIELA